MRENEAMRKATAEVIRRHQAREARRGVFENLSPATLRRRALAILRAVRS